MAEFLYLAVGWSIIWFSLAWCNRITSGAGAEIQALRREIALLKNEVAFFRQARLAESAKRENEG